MLRALLLDNWPSTAAIVAHAGGRLGRRALGGHHLLREVTVVELLQVKGVLDSRAR